jgi:hypothetical protein
LFFEILDITADFEDHCLAGCDPVWFGGNERFTVTYCLYLQVGTIPFLKIETVDFIETLKNIYEATQLYVKVKISLLQAVEAHRVVRGQGSHIT